MALAPIAVSAWEHDEAVRVVAAHRSGDTKAFDEVVRAHSPALLSRARRRLGNHLDAEDAVQETLLRAYRALDRFGTSGDWKFGAWLNRILSNVCNDLPPHGRANLPLLDGADGVAEPRERVGPPDISELVPDPVAMAALRGALATLPSSQANAFVLRMLGDLPYDEVADRLGISEDNARARVTRARSALRRKLEGAAAVGRPARDEHPPRRARRAHREAAAVS